MEGAREERSPRFPALLRFLVYPRNLTSSPYRSAETRHKGAGGTLGSGVCMPEELPLISGTTLQSREGDADMMETISIALSAWGCRMM